MRAASLSGNPDAVFVTLRKPIMNENPNTLAEDSSYQAPRVETIITPDDLAREVAYAGTTTLNAA